MAVTGLQVGKQTDVGQRRDHNEDEHAVFDTEGGATVLVVADGMGGHLAGEVASKLAIDVLRRELTPLAADSETGPTDALRAAIEQANREIWAEADRDAEKAGMGSTIVAAIIQDGTAYLANAGDSPAYLVRGAETEQLTDDHGLVAEQVAMGVIPEAAAEHHPFRHILTRCLGAESEVDVQTYEPRELEPGDVLILCSDGLTEHVGRHEVAAMTASADPDEIARGLVDEANRRGGHDNITVVVARVV
jgi:protein phosphatase